MSLTHQLHDYEQIRRDKGIESAYAVAVADVVVARNDAMNLEHVLTSLLKALVAEGSVDPTVPKCRGLAKELLDTKEMGRLNRLVARLSQ